jgi:hypothetical protein
MSKINFPILLLDKKIAYFTPFLFENAHSGAFSSAKSNGSMRIFNAQRCIYSDTNWQNTTPSSDDIPFVNSIEISEYDYQHGE